MNDVRDEALAALLDRAADPIHPPSAERLPDVVRRGSRRRAGRLTFVVTAVFVFVGAIAWAGLTFPRDRVIVPSDVEESPEPIHTFRDERDGLSVTVPDGWFVAEENITPWLSSPVEILSLGTFNLRVSEHPEDGFRLFDAPVAPAALEDMRADDAFVSLQESGGEFTGPREDRPEHFGPLPCEQAIYGCRPAEDPDLPEEWRDVPFQAWWIPFEDAGRGLYLFVAIGNDASPELRDQAWAVADSLVFVPNDA
jgi:hypothetical protein